MKVVIKKSTNPKKKYMAVFYDKNKKKVKTTHFGAAGMSDYTKHKDKSRKRRYLTRHRNREKWNELTVAEQRNPESPWNKYA